MQKCVYLFILVGGATPSMAAAVTTIPEDTCRFCSRSDSQLDGIKICDCDGHCGYAHYKCFFNYVRETGRRKCDYCRKEWFVDKARWKQDILRHNRVTVCNRVREAASILLTIFVILAMILLWGFIVKISLWIIYGKPDYILFGVPMLISGGWTRITLGDGVTGGLFTLGTILVAILIVHLKSKCYKSCCMKKKSYKKLNPNANETEQTESDNLELRDLNHLTSLSDARALEHSRSLSRQISLQSTVELGPEDSSSISGDDHV